MRMIAPPLALPAGLGGVGGLALRAVPLLQRRKRRARGSLVRLSCADFCRPRKTCNIPRILLNSAIFIFSLTLRKCLSQQVLSRQVAPGANRVRAPHRRCGAPPLQRPRGSARDPSRAIFRGAEQVTV